MDGGTSMLGPRYWRAGHIVLSLYHLVIGIYVLAAFKDDIKNSKVDIFVRIPDITIDESSGEKVYDVVADRRHVVGSVSPILLHGVVSCLTAGSHFLSYIAYDRYGLKRYRPNPIRWGEYSVTATLMTISGFVGIGSGDLFFLLSISMLGVLLQYCGYRVEETAIKNNWKPYFYLGVVVQIAIALPLIYGTAAASRDEGGGGLVVLLVCYILYYSSFAVNSYYDAAVLAPRSVRNGTASKIEMEKKSPEKKSLAEDKDFMMTDERYAVLSVTSKTALFW